MDHTSVIKKLIQEKETVIKRESEAIEHLRAILLKEQGGKAGATRPQEKKRSHVLPFTRKYAKTAADYVEELLSKSQGARLSQRDILAALAKEGKTYTTQSMAHALRKLESKGILTKKHAPEGSKARFVYKIGPNRGSAAKIEG